MRYTIIIFFLSLILPFQAHCQRNIGEQIAKERIEEFAQSHQKQTIYSLFTRQTLTLSEFNQKLGLVIENHDSSYFVNTPRHERSDPKKWYFRYQVRRDLDFNVEQLIRGVITKGFWLDFHLLIRNDTILGVKLLEGGRTLYEKVFQEKYDSYQKQHEEFYNVNLKKYDEEYSPFNFYNFGTFMGVHESILRHCYLMIKYYNKSDKKNLVKWLKSMNPELQAYAVQGLYYLNKYKNISLTEEEVRLVNHISGRRTTVHVNPMVPTKEVLNSEYFDEAYVLLKSKKYIKN